MERLINDNEAIRSDLAAFRDDMMVLTAMVMRVDGKLDRIDAR